MANCRIFVSILKKIMFKKKVLENKILERISRKKGTVFVRADFKDLAGYDQVGRALRNLVRKKKKSLKLAMVFMQKQNFLQFLVNKF